MTQSTMTQPGGAATASGPPLPPGEPEPFAEEQYFELRARLERMNEGELARFRAAPENQAMLRQFDRYVWRKTLPYMVALVAVLAASVAIATLLVL